MKSCPICKQTKPLDQFHKKSSSPDGKQSMCKSCNLARVKKWQAENPERHTDNWKRHTSNRNNLVRKARQYNISLPDLEKLLEIADGKCEICRKTPDRWVVIDHCHDSLRIRGVLCERCNQALGLFGDSVDALRSAIEYLIRKPLEYEQFQALPRNKYK